MIEEFEKSYFKSLTDFIRAEYKAQEDGSFIVFLRVIEFEKVEFEIKVNAYSKEQVQKIINKWKKDATIIYNQIIQLLNND